MKHGLTRIGIPLLLGVLASLCPDAEATSALGPRELNAAFTLLQYSDGPQPELKLLADRVHAYLRDPANATALRTPEGTLLRQQHAKLTNMIAVKDAFEKCRTGKESRRNLYVRLVDAAGKTDLHLMDCNRAVAQFPTVDALLESIEPITGTPAKSRLHDLLTERALKNAVTQFLHMQHRYGGEHVTMGQLHERFCKDGGIEDVRCGEIYHELSQHGMAYAKALRDRREPQVTAHHAADEINAQVAKLNARLAAIQVKERVAKGWLYDSKEPDYADLETQLQYGRYVQEFQSTLATPSGNLLMTEHLRKKAGTLQTLDSAERTREIYSYTRHSAIKAEDVRIAVKEAQDQIVDQGRMLLELRRDKLKTESKSKGASTPALRNQLDRDLNRLIKSNPAAIGQILANHPEYAALVCERIAAIEREDKSDAAWDKAFFWGGIIVGGALLVTGVGTAAGAWILAGTATAATLATVATAATVAGVAVGLTETAYQGGEMLEARREMQDFEAAYFGGSGDGDTGGEMAEAYASFREARMQMILSGVFTAVDLGALSGALKVGAMGARLSGRALSSAEKAQKLKAITRALQQIQEQLLSHPALLSRFTRLKEALGPRAAEFMAWVAQAPESIRLSLLEKMKDWPYWKLHVLAEEALALAKNCD